MSLKFPFLLVLVLCASCFHEHEPKRTDRWYVDNWEVSGGCFFIAEGPEEKIQIVEMLLGMEDPEKTETELLLRGDGEMQILKNGAVVLSGKWAALDPHTLTFTANGQFWNFEVVNRTEDSILLRGKNYQYIYQMDIVLKRR